jgi:hypothetical protein
MMRHACNAMPQQVAGPHRVIMEITEPVRGAQHHLPFAFDDVADARLLEFHEISPIRPGVPLTAKLLIPTLPNAVPFEGVRATPSDLPLNTFRCALLRF